MPRVALPRADVTAENEGLRHDLEVAETRRVEQQAKAARQLAVAEAATAAALKTARAAEEQWRVKAEELSAELANERQSHAVALDAAQAATEAAQAATAAAQAATEAAVRRAEEAEAEMMDVIQSHVDERRSHTVALDAAQEAAEVAVRRAEVAESEAASAIVAANGRLSISRDEDASDGSGEETPAPPTPSLASVSALVSTGRAHATPLLTAAPPAASTAAPRQRGNKEA